MYSEFQETSKGYPQHLFSSSVLVQQNVILYLLKIYDNISTEITLL